MNGIDKLRVVTLRVACPEETQEDVSVESIAAMLASGSACEISREVSNAACALEVASNVPCTPLALEWMSAPEWYPATGAHSRCLDDARTVDALGVAAPAVRAMYAAACALEPSNMGAWFSALWCEPVVMASYGELVERAEAALVAAGASPQQLFDYVWAPAIAIRINYRDFDRAGKLLHRCYADKDVISQGAHPGVSLITLLNEYKNRKDEYRQVRTVPWGTPYADRFKKGPLAIKSDHVLSKWIHARVTYLEESSVDFYADLYSVDKPDVVTSGTVRFEHTALSKSLYGQSDDLSWVDGLSWGEIFELAVTESGELLAHRYPIEVVPNDLVHNKSAWNSELWMDPHRYLRNYRPVNSTCEAEGTEWADRLRKYGWVELRDGRWPDVSALEDYKPEDK